MHFQRGDFAQAKIVEVMYGSVIDVVVDMRPESPSYRQWTSALLTPDNNRQLYIPRGFAHGFLVLSDEVEFAYKCTDFYHPGDEGGMAWNDPEIGIAWPLQDGVKLIISEKDQNWGGLADTFRF